MQKLIDFYKNNTSEIFTLLNETDNASELVRAATLELDKLIGKGSKFHDELTPREQRLVTSYFNPLINSLYLLYKAEVKVELPAIKENSKHDSHNYAESLVAVLSSTLAATLVPGVVPAILAGLASGGVAMFAADKINSTKNSDFNNEQAISTTAPFSIHLKPEEVQSCIKLAVENFDNITSEIDEIQKEALEANLAKPVNLETMTSVLEFFQEMLGFQHTADLPNDLQNYLPKAQRILNRYGIDVVLYQKDVNDDFFEHQSNYGKGVDVPTLIKPALLKDGRAILKGIVVLPENQGNI